MKWIEKGLEVICVALLLLLVGVVTLQIFSRVLNLSIIWTEELARYALVYITFLGAALAYYKGEGLKITTLTEKFPKKLRIANEYLMGILTILVNIFVAYISISLINSLWDNPTPSLRWSKGMVTLILPVGFALILLKNVQELRRIKESFNN